MGGDVTNPSVEGLAAPVAEPAVVAEPAADDE